MKNVLWVFLLILTFCNGATFAQDAFELNAIAIEEAKIPKAPRSVADVLNLLERYQTKPEVIQKLVATADSKAPANGTETELSLFYQRRATAAEALGRLNQAAEDAKYAIEFGPKNAGTESARDLIGDAYTTAITSAYTAGDPISGIEYSRLYLEVLKNAPYNGGFVLSGNRFLIGGYLMLGDTAEASIALSGLERGYAETRSYRKGFAEFGDNWTQNYRMGKGYYYLAIGKAVEAEFDFLRAKEANDNLREREARGDFKFSSRRTFNASSLASMRDIILRSLGRATLEQGKSAQAEYWYREALKTNLEEQGRGSPRVSFALSGLSRAVAEQGRLDEAVLLSKASLQSMKESGAADSSLNMIEARRAYADALSTNGSYKQALEQYGLVKQGLVQNHELQSRMRKRGNFEEQIALLESGQNAEAETQARTMVDELIKQLGENHPRVAMAQAFYGAALDRSGKYSDAIQRFSKAMPVLIGQAQQSSEAGSQSVRQQKRLSIVIEAYIDALFKSGTTNKDNQSLAFQLSDIAKGSNVQKAMTQSAARVSIKDPGLSDLARKEQDAQRQIQSLSELQASLAAAPSNQQLPGIQTKLKSDVDKLKEQRDDLRKEIARKFPEYADLVNPKPVTVDRVAKLMQSGEVLVNWYLGDWGSYVWVISNKGLVAASALQVTRAQVALDVSKLRKSLDPNVTSVDEIPPYDLATANNLYNKLIAPVKSSLDGQKVVLAVPHAELGQLPIAVLTTKAFPQPGKGSQGFAGYRNAPWLVRDIAILQLPSVTALAALRAAPKSTESNGSFIGFGDPYFSPDQANGFKVADSGSMTSRGKPLKLRSVPNTRGVSSAELALLPRLPDTEYELKDVGAVFKADPDKDIYLHERASVANVLQADLSNKSVVMFSTHGLVPGDLDGLTQPALAMSSPLVTGEKQGDGLLKMDQVLNLKLNADWVVLSACNTAAGSGKDTEAVSGLGRAFFYAGARAMLVSNWPVDTVSSRMLMVDIFKRQQEKKIGKPEALRQAELELADKGNSSGYAYAHPLFWAPFVVIGD